MRWREPFYSSPATGDFVDCTGLRFNRFFIRIPTFAPEKQLQQKVQRSEVLILWTVWKDRRYPKEYCLVYFTIDSKDLRVGETVSR